MRSVFDESASDYGAPCNDSASDYGPACYGASDHSTSESDASPDHAPSCDVSAGVCIERAGAMRTDRPRPV